MSLDPRCIQLARNSTIDYKQTAKKLLGGDNSQVADELGEAAPYLCGRINKDSLAEYELYSIIEWLERPEGPPPSARFHAFREMLKSCRGVITDELIEEWAQSARVELE